jgi:hypothetical protein
MLPVQFFVDLDVLTNLAQCEAGKDFKVAFVDCLYQCGDDWIIQGCMVEVDKLICVVASIQTVCFHHWWDGWSVTTGVIVSDFEISDPAIVDGF